MLTRAECERLDVLCSAATAGPWRAMVTGKPGTVGGTLTDICARYPHGAEAWFGLGPRFTAQGWEPGNANAELIAESRTALPAALATIRELVEALDHARLCPAHSPPCDRCDGADVILAAWDGADHFADARNMVRHDERTLVERIHDRVWHFLLKSERGFADWWMSLTTEDHEQIRAALHSGIEGELKAERERATDRRGVE